MPLPAYVNKPKSTSSARPGPSQARYTIGSAGGLGIAAATSARPHRISAESESDPAAGLASLSCDTFTCARESVDECLLFPVADQGQGPRDGPNLRTPYWHTRLTVTDIDRHGMEWTGWPVEPDSRLDRPPPKSLSALITAQRTLRHWPTLSTGPLVRSPAGG